MSARRESNDLTTDAIQSNEQEAGWEQAVIQYQNVGDSMKTIVDQPPDFCFNGFLIDLAYEITEADLKDLKHHFEGQCSISETELSEINNAMDLFSLLRKKKFLDRHNLVYLQVILRRIRRQDLVKKAVDHVKEQGWNAFHFYTDPTPEIVAGRNPVYFHFVGNVDGFSLESLRDSLSRLLFAPREVVIINGIRLTSSTNVTCWIPPMYIEVLEYVLREMKHEYIDHIQLLGVNLITIGDNVYELTAKSGNDEHRLRFESPKMSEDVRKSIIGLQSEISRLADESRKQKAINASLQMELKLAKQEKDVTRAKSNIPSLDTTLRIKSAGNRPSHTSRKNAEGTVGKQFMHSSSFLKGKESHREENTYCDTNMEWVNDANRKGMSMLNKMDKVLEGAICSAKSKTFIFSRGRQDGTDKSSANIKSSDFNLSVFGNKNYIPSKPCLPDLVKDIQKAEEVEKMSLKELHCLDEKVNRISIYMQFFYKHSGSMNRPE